MLESKGRIGIGGHPVGIAVMPPKEEARFLDDERRRLNRTKKPQAVAKTARATNCNNDNANAKRQKVENQH
jgi:hypothetical protein